MEFLLVAVLINTLVMAFGARSCNQRPLPGCTCWNMRRPTVSCIGLNLNKVPELSTDYIYSLDLSLNNITVMADEKLGHDGLRLFKLKMSHSVSIISPDISNDWLDNVASSLTLLDLSYNHMKRIPEAVNHASSMQHLDLSYNNITEVLDTHLNALLALKTLYLVGNPITEIESNAFSFNRNLNALSLTLRGEALYPMPKTSFAEHLSQLKWLQLKELSLLTMSTAYMKFLFQKLVSLEHLYLENSTAVYWKIKSDKELFSGIKSTLKVLSLRSNTVAELPDELMEDMDSLEELDVSDNKMVFFYSLSCWKNLRKLSARNNRIYSTTAVSEYAVPKCFPKMEVIDLRDNRLSSISPYTCADLGRNGVKLLLSGNRIDCRECYNINPIFSQAANMSLAASSCNDREATCNMPFSVRGKLISESLEICDKNRQ